jgi:hypothetical protein
VDGKSSDNTCSKASFQSTVYYASDIDMFSNISVVIYNFQVVDYYTGYTSMTVSDFGRK